MGKNGHRMGIGHEMRCLDRRSLRCLEKRFSGPPTELYENAGENGWETMQNSVYTHKI